MGFPNISNMHLTRLVSNKAGGYPFNLIAKLFLSFFGGTGV
jgi:hypothetical protein